MSLPFNKTIFVMEDVDAASSVVQRRNGGGAAASAGPSRAEVMALAESIANAKLAAAASAAAVGRSASSRGGCGDGASSADGDEHHDQEKGGKGEIEEADSDDEARANNGGQRRGQRGSAGAAGGGGGGGGVGASASSASGWEVGGGTAIGPSLPMAAFGKNLFKGDDELNLAGALRALRALLVPVCFMESVGYGFQWLSVNCSTSSLLSVYFHSQHWIRPPNMLSNTQAC